MLAVGNEEIEKIDNQRLCNPKLLRCRKCDTLLKLGESKPRGIIYGKCEKCNVDYMIAIEEKKLKDE